MNPAVVCENLTRTFRWVRAVDGLSLEIPEGSVYALVGPNGAGKTTLIKMLLNIVRPSRGRAEVLGRDSRLLKPADYGRVGYVSENQEMPDWMTVSVYLAYLKPFYPRWDDELARAMVRDFDLAGGRKLGKLSRGMRMKAALASALAFRPSLIVLDEPFSGLDVLARDEFIQGLVSRLEDTTVLVSSHDLADIETFASHVGFMEGGRIQSSEELALLSARFREIEVTFEEEPFVPAEWPGSWLKPETRGHVLRFIETQFREPETMALLSGLFPAALDTAVRGMTLREIFVATARARRKAE